MNHVGAPPWWMSFAAQVSAAPGLRSRSPGFGTVWKRQTSLPVAEIERGEKPVRAVLPAHTPLITRSPATSGAEDDP